MAAQITVVAGEVRWMVCCVWRTKCALLDGVWCDMCVLLPIAAAVFTAFRNGHALMLQLLLSQPGVKHIRSFGASSTTPLQEAQAAHHTTCVALLSAHLQKHQQHNQQQQPEQLQSSPQQHPDKQHQQAKALPQASNKKPRQGQHKQAGLSPAGRRAGAPGFSAVRQQHVDRGATVVC